MVPSSEDLVKGARQSLAPVGDLEAVLRRKLNEARIVRECNATETRGSDGSARIKELGVVEEVERFSADLERLVFGESNSLGDPHIGVEGSRSMENIAT